MSIETAQLRKELHRLEATIQRTEGELARLRKQQKKLANKLAHISIYATTDSEAINERNDARS